MPVLSTLRPHTNGPYGHQRAAQFKLVPGTRQAHNFQRRGDRRIELVLSILDGADFGCEFGDILENQFTEVRKVLSDRGYHVVWIQNLRENRNNDPYEAAIRAALTAARTSIREIVEAKCLKVRKTLENYGHVIVRKSPPRPLAARLEALQK